MKIIHAMLAFMLAFILAACQTTPTQATDQGSVIKTNSDGSKIENLSDYALYAKIASESKPIFEMTCPPAGCVLTSLKVNAPQDKSALAAPVAPETASTVFVKGFFGLAHDVIGLGPWYFGSKVLTKAFDKANASVTTTNTSIDSSNRSVNSDSSNRSTTTNTTTTTNTNTNSNNVTRTCTSGQAGNGGGTTTGGAGGGTGSPSC
jgi:hypothetical protein